MLYIYSNEYTYGSEKLRLNLCLQNTNVRNMVDSKILQNVNKTSLESKSIESFIALRCPNLGQNVCALLSAVKCFTIKVKIKIYVFAIGVFLNTLANRHDHVIKTKLNQHNFGKIL